ncbi:MAG: Gfo/Idh/MocA family oxidoreductase [Sphaerochaetaceae bacterium]|nr:Gfo/Idh/MocA family oxidoreductase [Sphaerochaetaceae bacterium]
METIRIGIVGAGERGCYVLGSRIIEMAQELDLRITALCDINSQRITDATDYLTSQAKVHQLTWDHEIMGTTDYRAIIDNPQVNAVLITTHTDNHLEPTLYALASGKFVYLDKPISVTLDDAHRILDQEKATGNTLIMGFTRRYEGSWRKAYELLRSGEIGELQMMQIHSVIPYMRYYQMWHRVSAFSGGALNDKVSHLVDVFNWMNGASRCQSVVAMGGRSTFIPERTDAPFRCSECDDTSCPYRRKCQIDDDKEGTHVLERESWKHAKTIRDSADTCVYYPGADIIDHAIATYQYENGVKASLFWAIYGPHAHDQETLELVGSRGRIMVERETGQVRVMRILDGYQKEEAYTLEVQGEYFSSSHYGADIQLLKEIHASFHALSKGNPTADSSDGLESLRMIHATVESIEGDGKRVTL